MNLQSAAMSRQYRTEGCVYTSLLVLCIWGCAAFALARPAAAQQEIAYVNSDEVLQQMPEYTSVQQELEQLEEEWRSEIQSQEEEVQRLVEEFQARELLYTPDERERQQERIREARREVERLRSDYFGPEGQLFQRQQELMRPLQERVLEVVEGIAEAAGYDYVFDTAGEYLFMYARPQHNLTEDVILELGIDNPNTPSDSNN
ncbi:hypothetical protein CRI93_08785 [Longimonas halophila]|uniref:Molecular chaperone Skp n=1 Tax=Longimonas halophila TaxID=1469170 RepID=A0A2H3P6S2_9BACT|nr:hypothetical protein CRI93_08785 [Longimonas halophila]